MVRYIHILRWLSLDIVLGGAVLLFFLGTVFHIQIPAVIYLCLSIAIWIVYTADHLQDAARVANPSAERHIFHKKHFKVIAISMAIMTLVGMGSAMYLSVEILKQGVTVAMISIVYLLISRRFSIMGLKELYVAAVYAYGIFLYPMVALKAKWGLLEHVLIVQLGLVAFINLLVMSYYDHERDAEDGFGSFTLLIGKAGVRSVLIGLISISIGIAVWMLWNHHFVRLQFYYFFCLFTLSMIISFNRFFGQNDRFRIFGDGIFLFPLLFI
ncbi:MAG: hypothetical protein JXQ90_11065 [Cyclobacteriaceae bacterium]